MSEQALVFMDTENAFFFARRANRTEGVNEDHLAAARELDPEVSYFDVATRGPAVFRRLAAWLERDYVVVGRSYGKGVAAGVEAVVDEVVARQWLHVLVYEGKDVADDALLEDLHLRAERPHSQSPTLVVVTSDGILLGKIKEAVGHTGLDIMAILGPRPLNPKRFDVGGELEPIWLGTSIPRLYAEMTEKEQELASVADHVAVYHPRDLLTRGHIRDRLLTSPDLQELDRRTAELNDAAHERAMFDDRYERLVWIATDAAERRTSLARPIDIPTDFDLDNTFPQPDGFLHRP